PFKEATRCGGVVRDGSKRLIEFMSEGRSHFAHQGNTVSMGHLFALMLQLKISLLLCADVQSHSDRFQQVPFLIFQTAPAHNYPPHFAVGQKKTVLAFERPGKCARTIISCFDIRSLIWVNA